MNDTEIEIPGTCVRNNGVSIISVSGYILPPPVLVSDRSAHNLVTSEFLW